MVNPQVSLLDLTVDDVMRALIVSKNIESVPLHDGLLVDMVNESIEEDSNTTWDEDLNKYVTSIRVQHVTRIQGSKQHSLQAVTADTNCCANCVETPAPSNEGPIYRFLGKPAMRTRWMAGAAPNKSG